MEPDKKVTLITTADGSTSLVRVDLNETYHSVKGARSESAYVFIDQGLAHFHKKRFSTGKIILLEVGLGTGLNTLLSAGFAEEHPVELLYQALEPYPVPDKMYTQFSFTDSRSEQELLRQVHESDWNIDVKLSEKVTFKKVRKTLETFDSNDRFHIIFFDAFAPSRQPEVWSVDNLKKCYDLLIPGGILVTYCAQGQFKRDLKALGYEVEELPGALGKKEMVRASKL